MSFSIRRAKPIAKDADTLFQFVCALAKYERELSKVEVTSKILLAQMGQSNPPFEALIAETSSGVSVGFALYFQTYSTWKGKPGIWLEDIFVLEEMRGKGIGKLLIQSVIDIAIGQECGRVEWSVLDWNKPSIGFYRSIGARILEDWKICRLEGDELAKK